MDSWRRGSPQVGPGRHGVGCRCHMNEHIPVDELISGAAQAMRRLAGLAAGRTGGHQRRRDDRALEPGRAGAAGLHPTANAGAQHRRARSPRSRSQPRALTLGGRRLRSGRHGHGDRLAPRRAPAGAGDLGLSGVRPCGTRRPRCWSSPPMPTRHAASGGRRRYGTACSPAHPSASPSSTRSCGSCRSTPHSKR